MRCLVIGPRGGFSEVDVSCDTCVSANKCVFSGPSTKPFGCFDWVDIDGRRVVTTKAAAIEAAMPPDDIAAADLPVEVAEATMEKDDA
jgi:hypothetical protein